MSDSACQIYRENLPSEKASDERDEDFNSEMAAGWFRDREANDT